MSSINLENLSPEEFAIFLDSFDYVISDCDGVLWHDIPIPGSGDFINTMKIFNKRCYFVSNNSTNSAEKYMKKFDACGIKYGYDNLMIPSVGIVEYLKSKGFNKKIFSVSCGETTKLLEKNGYKCCRGPTCLDDDVGLTFLCSLLVNDLEIGAVILDSDYAINMARLWIAEWHLKRPDVHFIAGAPDKNVPLVNGVMGIGLGYFIDILCERLQRKPLIIAKPGKIYAEQLLKRFKIDNPGRVLFIGDTIQQDIKFAKVAGFTSLFVLTTFKLEEALKADLPPDYYATSLGALLPLLNAVKNRKSSKV